MRASQACRFSPPTPNPKDALRRTPSRCKRPHIPERGAPKGARGQPLGARRLQLRRSTGKLEKGSRSRASGLQGMYSAHDALGGLRRPQSTAGWPPPGSHNRQSQRGPLKTSKSEKHPTTLHRNNHATINPRTGTGEAARSEAAGRMAEPPKGKSPEAGETAAGGKAPSHTARGRAKGWLVEPKRATPSPGLVARSRAKGGGPGHGRANC